VNLRPVGWVFVLFGIFWGGWAVAAVDVERSLHLSTGGFGLLLSLALVGAATSNAVGGPLCERFGTGRVLGTALLAWSVFLALGAVVRVPVAMELLIIVMVATAGLIDIAINVAATAALADRPGRLVAFHARFNGGAAAGAALTGVLLGVGASWRWLWIGVAVVAVGLGVVCGRARLPAGDPGDQVPLGGTFALLRRERLLLVAGAFALAAMVEGGIELWGVLFLRTYLSSGLLIGAGGAVLGYSVAALARFTLGPTVGSKGSGRGVMLGAGAAAVGVAVLATAGTAVFAAIGLVLAAGGISMCWPLLLAQAGAGRSRAGAVVGAVSAVGYLGLVMGPAVVGWVAEAIGLRAALGVLGAAAVIVALVPIRSKSFSPPASLPRPVR
jgi:Major Facilitator Superfamily